MNNKEVHITTILSKWHKLSDEMKNKLSADLDKYMTENAALSEQAKEIQIKMMAFDKAIMGWMNSWVSDDKPAN